MQINWVRKEIPACENQALKVSKFQNEFMKSWFLPKYEPNIVRISALNCATLQGRNPYNFWFIFWENRWLYKFILKLTDLYDIFSSSKGSADDSQKGSVPKTIVEPSQAPSSNKADGSSPPLLSTGAKAKRPKTSGGAAGVGASVKRTTSEMKNDLAPKTKQVGLTGRKLSRDRKKI